MSKLLVNKLNKERDRELDEIKSNAIVKEAETLLLEAHSEDNEILSKIGLDHQISYSRQLQQDAVRSKRVEEIYKAKSFTGKQIKRLCNKYDLRILKASEYNGTIPVDLSRKIKEFCNERDLPIRMDSFYILAPVGQFRTVKFVPRSKDHIIFYLEGSEKGTRRYDHIRESDHLFQVHNWGNDFSLLRQYRWLFNKYYETSDSVSNFARTVFIVIPLIILNLISGLIGLHYATNVILCSFMLTALVCSYLHKENQLSELRNSNKK